MQLRIKGVTLSKNGRRWVEYVVEVKNHHGWTVLGPISISRKAEVSWPSSRKIMRSSL
jgi:hypothetical protein